MIVDISAYRNIGLPPRVTRFYGNIDFALDVICNQQPRLCLRR
jgi:hypothetical protein